MCIYKKYVGSNKSKSKSRAKKKKKNTPCLFRFILQLLYLKITENRSETKASAK